MSRKAAEQQFYDRYYKADQAPSLNGFYFISGGPAYYKQRVLVECENKRVLEYGCGTGGAGMTWDLADRGATVTAIDISETAIALARERATHYPPGVLTLERADAEALPFPDASFDIICGSGILHHLDIQRAIAEVRRVLKPGGRAVFYEPLAYNPIARLYRFLTPGEHTPDEHPLTTVDLALFRSSFPQASFRWFDFFSIGAIPFLRFASGRRLLRALEAADRALFRAMPIARHWAMALVLEGGG